MLVLVRKNDEVYFNNQKLTIVKQASKGPGKEVVKIVDLPGSNGQKWVSLSKLKQGENTVETKETVRASSSYQLTEDEKLEVEKLQKQINSIIEKARKRFVPFKKVNEYTVDELERLIELKRQELNK